MLYRILGTPNEDVWPGVTSLPDYKPSFPQWQPKQLEDEVANLDDVSNDLLAVSEHVLALATWLLMPIFQKMLYYDPARRLSAKQALQHPYFGLCSPTSVISC